MKNCRLPRVVSAAGTAPVSDVLHMRRMRKLARADVTPAGRLPDMLFDDKSSEVRPERVRRAPGTKLPESLLSDMFRDMRIGGSWPREGKLPAMALRLRSIAVTSDMVLRVEGRVPTNRLPGRRRAVILRAPTLEVHVNPSHVGAVHGSAVDSVC